MGKQVRTEAYKMFCDEVTVQFIGGRGGNGCVGFRREKYVPRGGPNGGDAGKGGTIYLVADENINTLAEFNTRKNFRAADGENGLGKDMGGHDASDLMLPVPVGTIIFPEKGKTPIADLTKSGDTFLAARGGRGGFGNAHFKSSTRQAPAFAELGEPGEKHTIKLELKLVADVGIIGLPSVGKSTLISRISNARPKIAEYHFTTLVPNLGLVNMKPFGGSLQQNFLACDLPGLIEDAHKGKGLGIKFLKHVARNKILVHLIDINAIDPAQDYKIIMGELRQFDRKLAKKPHCIAFNKTEHIDQETVKEIIKNFKKTARKKENIFAISAVTGQGLKELIWEVWRLLEAEKKKEHEKKPEREPKKIKLYQPHLEEDSHRFTAKILRDGKTKRAFLVTGPRIDQIVIMTNTENPEAVARVYDVCEKMGINRELRRIGAKFGDEFRICESTFLYRWR